MDCSEAAGVLGGEDRGLARGIADASFDAVYVAEALEGANGTATSFRLVGMNAPAARRFARSGMPAIDAVVSDRAPEWPFGPGSAEAFRAAIEEGVVIEEELPASPSRGARRFVRRVAPLANGVVVAVRDLGYVERRERHAGLRAVARIERAKDPAMVEHAERVADLAAPLARRLGWSEAGIDALREAALLHDVGKLGVPESILLKPESLRPEEYEIVKRHVAMSAEIASELLEPDQVRWIRAHQERWDGRGYPEGLVGPEIPSGACILALADTWDVITHWRPYSNPMSFEEARLELVRERGRQLAPDAVDALLDLEAEGHLVPPPVEERPLGATTQIT